jgi:hypothetical protein
LQAVVDLMATETIEENMVVVVVVEVVVVELKK